MTIAIDDPLELLDLYDEHDRPQGITIQRQEIERLRREGGGYIRCINAFIVNDHHELLVMTRSPSKRFCPNGLDYSVGEHVHAGESYDQAAARGFWEELGMRVDPKRLTMVGKVMPDMDGSPYFAAVYLYHGNDVPDYNKNDFVAHQWLLPAALLYKLDQGVPAKQDIRLSLQVMAAADMAAN